MNLKTKKRKNQVVINNSVNNVVSDEELNQRIDSINTEMKAATWRDLEINRKFGKNEKLSFISDDTLIVGCDIGSETHYIRVIDSRGRELNREAFSFSNTAEGFQAAKEWVINIAARHNKKQIVLGIEPTGHYWFCIASWMIANGISVVQVNPYAVKQTKELEDNSQDKNDRKDPKLIANLVKDGNYGMPYLPEDIYAELRHLSMLRDQLSEDRIRTINRLHREMKIYFPEYMEAFGKLDSVFAQEVIKNAPFPKDIVSLGTEGLKEIWHNAKLRGRGYNRAEQIFNCAEKSVGINEGTDAGREAVKWFANSIIELEEELEKVESILREKCLKIPYAENILETEIDLSCNKDLKLVLCGKNNLTELDLSNNKKLTFLECEHNYLYRLDLSMAPLLEGLRCSDNFLTDIELSENPELTELRCWGNHIKKKDLTNNLYLEDVKVDEETEVLYNEMEQLEYATKSRDDMTSYEDIAKAQKGDIVRFGSYRQSYSFNDLTLQPIEWIVLSNSEDGILLLSKNIITSLP